MKIIVHPGTGTIIDASECLIIDSKKLSIEDIEALSEALDNGYDDDVVAIARQNGNMVLSE